MTVGLLASGNSSTRKPLGKRYSQMPSTQGPATTDFGKVVVSPLACAAGINASESATARAQEDNFSISFPMIGTVDGMCGAALPRLVLQEIEFDTSGNTRHNCQK